MNELLNLKAAARRLGLAERKCEVCGTSGKDGVEAVRKMIDDGLIPIVRLPYKRGRFIKSSTLDRFIEEREEQ